MVGDLDKRVATTVMGLAICEGWQLINGVVQRNCDHAPNGCFPEEAPPAFSSDTELAWVVWTRVITLSPPTQWHWTFGGDNTISITWQPETGQAQRLAGRLPWAISAASLYAAELWWRDSDNGVKCPACKISIRQGWFGFHQRQCGS